MIVTGGVIRVYDTTGNVIETHKHACGPISKYVERACPDTLLWLISFSLDERANQNQ